MNITQEQAENLAELYEYIRDKPGMQIVVGRNRHKMWVVEIVDGAETDFDIEKHTFGLAVKKAVEWVKSRRAIENSHEPYEEDEDDEPQLAADLFLPERKVPQMMDTMPQWLYHRFGPPGVVDWDALSPEDQSYWRHEAEATKRAAERGGFKIDW